MLEFSSNRSNKKGLLLTWMVVTIIQTVSCYLLFAVLVFSSAKLGKNRGGEHHFGADPVVIGISAGIGALMSTYSWVIVYSCYRDMKDGDVAPRVVVVI